MARVDRTLKLTAQKEHFRALAQTDGLTGLPNFRSFHARLEEEVARAHRYGHPLACAMVDLDGLKEINDKLGHAAGNRAIVALADAVREELSNRDYEVVIVSDGDSALRMIEALRPDVIVLDLQLPHVSGPSVAAKLRMMERPPKVLICSAVPYAAEIAADLAADGVLLKPFVREDLRSEVERLIRT